MSNNIDKMVADSLLTSEPFIGFVKQLREAMTQYREKNGISVSEYSGRLNMPSHIVLAVEKGILPVGDIPLKYLLSLYRFHKYDLPDYTMTINVTHR